MLHEKVSLMCGIGPSYVCSVSMRAVQISILYRPHTTVKNAINMKSVSREKIPHFEGIFKHWTHDQEDLPFLQMFISFASQNLAVLCVKRRWNGFSFFWNFSCCLRSMIVRIESSCKDFCKSSCSLMILKRFVILTLIFAQKIGRP